MVSVLEAPPSRPTVDVAPPRDLYREIVPKGLIENLQYRKRMIEWAARSRDNQLALWIACERDILFWFNTFLWTYDPRLRGEKRGPFITYEFQDEMILKIVDAIESGVDIGVDKSRDQGASWIILMVFLWYFIFRPMCSFMCVSANAALVDKTGSPGSLFWKIDRGLEYLPSWMRPKLRPLVDRQNMQFTNPSNGSTITGAATTGDIARGDRRTAIMMDEFASFEIADARAALEATQKATDCRIYNSTPKGDVNPFADIMLRLDIPKIHLDWFNHPVQKRGLYTFEKGKLKIIDEDFWSRATVKTIEGCAPLMRAMISAENEEMARDVYPFVAQEGKDGELRSPYFDNECQRTTARALIAQELKRDYRGSAGQFFDADVLAQLKMATKDPFSVGELDYESLRLQPAGFMPDPKGRLSLWCKLDARGHPVTDREYVIGVDVSAGTGASNSCASVFDRKDHIQVAEFVSRYVRPEAFAEIVAVLARWFCHRSFNARGIMIERPAYVVWEALGVGSSFGARLWEVGHRRVYFHEDRTKITNKPTKRPGWYPITQVKNDAFTEFRRATAAKELQVCSEATISEMGEFIFGRNGEVRHSRALSSLDSSDAGKNHGDRVTAAVCAWLPMQGEVKPIVLPAEDTLPESCQGRRQEEREKRRRRERRFNW